MRGREAAASRSAEVRTPWSIERRREIELEYLSRVQAARTAYEQFKLAYNHERDLATTLLDDVSADGRLVFARCQNTYNAMMAALERYRTELKRFGALVIDRRLPEDYTP